MRDFIVEFFASTTGDDQMNYFSGETQERVKAFEGSARELAAGIYRVIDGELHHVISGLIPEEVRQRLDANSEHTR